MLSSGTLQHISKVFIGDIDGYFNYKTGDMLVEFFNTRLGFSDRYGPGFPSRWAYVVTCLEQLISEGRIDEFLNVILGTSYIMSEMSLSLVEAAEKSDEVLREIRKSVEADGYIITGSRGSYHLAEKDKDLEHIGYGGFANVYIQKSTGRIVKQLKDEFLTDTGIRHRFKREFIITQSLQDLDGIIRVFDFNENNFSYVMERADKTLEQYVNDGPNEDIRIRLIVKILSIMKAVHDRDVVHRDLSPNNIFIVNGKLKIADFGLGKDLRAITSHQTYLTRGMGQFLYCAPEQITLLREGDKRSDVYSLGRILSFVMTGYPDNNSHMFRSVAEKAQNHDPATRYQNAGDMLEAANRLIEVHRRGDIKREALEKIKAEQFDAALEAFIYEQSGDELCRALSDEKYVKAIRSFMDIDNNHAIHVMQLINNSYKDYCGRSFSAYDPIGDFAEEVINHYSYSVNEIAATILHHIAKVVNRFRAQGQIHSLIEAGVEPTIEEILNGGTAI